MNIRGTTTIVGLFGYPVSHTVSPRMHNAAFAAMELDYCYIPFSVEPERLGEAVRGIRALSLRGVNVTVPHKETVMQHLDRISSEAAEIGAVNTIVNDGGTLTGHNTDGRGFMESLKNSGIVVKGKKILMLGAGGAARSVGYYLAQHARELWILSRTRSKTDLLVNGIGGKDRDVYAFPSDRLPEKDFLSTIDMIVNATPLGLKPDDPFPLDPSLFQPSHIVCDLVYGNTKFLQAAGQSGCAAVNGQGMLLWQGIFAFELWTGRRPPVDVMRIALGSA